MLTIFFWLLAAFFNAVMDSTGDDVQYNQSIFSKLPYQFWNREQSWKYAKKIFGYHVDAWHLSKSAMITCFSLSFIFLRNWDWPWYVKLMFLALTWIITFNFFYNQVFKLKK